MDHLLSKEKTEILLTKEFPMVAPAPISQFDSEKIEIMNLVSIVKIQLQIMIASQKLALTDWCGMWGLSLYTAFQLLI